MSKMDATGIILAGGRSSRMGQDKGLMLMDGIPMIQHIINTLSALTDKIVIVANNPAYEKFGFPTYADIIRGKGPLAGIVTGLSVSETEKNWVMSCDSPYVSVELLQALVEALKDVDAVIPTYQNRVHPLIAVYRKSAITSLQQELELDHLKLMEANKSLRVNHFNADIYEEINFKNINTRKDLCK